MDPAKWKKIKKSGAFKRKKRKHYNLYKSDTNSKKQDDAEQSILENDVQVPPFEKAFADDFEYNYLEGMELSEASDTEISDLSDTDQNLQLSDNLQKWAIEFNISQAALRSLSGILNRRIPNSIPKDPRTLLNTNKEKINIIRVDTGEYWHNGVFAPLKKILTTINEELYNISLTFNIDGLPLYKSSRQQVWPILCHIFEKQKVPPFVVGIYAGQGKPTDLHAYLQCFVAEIKELIKKGVVYTTKKGIEVTCTVKINAFICDSPARALLKGVTYFNGKHGCLKCTVIGQYNATSKTTAFSQINCPKRNDADFRAKKYGEHHKNDSPLLEIPIDMVEDILVGDSLHLVDLGIMKKLLKFWRDGSVTYKNKWLPSNVTIISGFLLTCKLPTEIHRSLRSLDVLGHWKGSEFRTFLHYVSFIILEDFLCYHTYYHFLFFFCAITICSNRRYFIYLRLADEMLKYFVTSYGTIYGEGYVNSNVHNLSHLVEEVRRFGILQNFNAYKFENELYKIKKMIRQGNKPLTQIAKRLSEKDYVYAQHCNDNLIKETPYIESKKSAHGPITVVYFEDFILSEQNKDKWFLTANNHVIETVSVTYSSNNICLIGNQIENCTDVFEKPIKSSLLNIYKCNRNNVVKSQSSYNLSDIKCKLVSITYKEQIFFVPLLHSLLCYPPR